MSAAIASFIKFITPAVKTAVSKKGKISRAGKIALQKAANKAAIALEVTPEVAIKNIRAAAKLPPSAPKKIGKFTPKKPNPQSTKGKGSKGSNKGLTPAQRKEKAGLMAQSRKDMQATKRGDESPDVGTGSPPGGRQRILIDVPGSKNRQRIVADPQNKLKGSQQFSKAELENMNEAEKLEYRLKGIGGQSGTMKARSGKGDMDAQSKKYGGKVKRNMGGKVAPRKKTVYRRGGGKALRGFGKATYSNKMY
jgi:hypothetical protein